MPPTWTKVGAFLPVATRYFAICGSCGALAGLLAPLMGLEPGMAFALGFLLASGPLTVFYSSARRLEWELRHWKNLHDKKLIADAEYKEVVRIVLKSFTTKWYGGAVSPLLPPNPPPDSESPPKME